jgi:hypothetical protein
MLVMSLRGAVVVRHGKGVIKLCTQGRERDTDEEISLSSSFVCERSLPVSRLQRINDEG